MLHLHYSFFFARQVIGHTVIKHQHTYCHALVLQLRRTLTQNTWQ